MSELRPMIKVGRMGQVSFSFTTDSGRMNGVVQVDHKGKTSAQIEAEARLKVKALASVKLAVTMKSTAKSHLMHA